MDLSASNPSNPTENLAAHQVARQGYAATGEVGMKQPNILEEELRKLGFELDNNTASMLEATLYRVLVSKLVDEIERLREDAATWCDRYEAERQDHEATMRAWDEELGRGR